MLEGNKQLLGPDGEVFEWTGEVWSSEAFSSHADQNDLLNWVSTNNANSQIYLLHGEPSSKTAFKEKLLEKGSKKVEIPIRGSVFNL
jgi:metallo-beta-lactamase family protein